MAVTHRRPLRELRVLGPNDIVDLGLEHLAEHAEPDADAQREQAVLRRVHQLAERLLHARRQRELASVAILLYGPHGGPFVSVD
jgi:hypothetical protein